MPPFVTTVRDGTVPVVPECAPGALPQAAEGRDLTRQPVASFAVAPTVAVLFVYAPRMGFRITMAINAARMLSVAAVMNTPCQFPFAAYMRPVLVVAYVPPKVSVTVAGKRL